MTNTQSQLWQVTFADGKVLTLNALDATGAMEFAKEMRKDELFWLSESERPRPVKAEQQPPSPNS